MTYYYKNVLTPFTTEFLNIKPMDSCTVLWGDSLLFYEFFNYLKDLLNSPRTIHVII